MRTRVGVVALTVLLSAGCGDIQEVASDAAPTEVDAAVELDAAPPPGPCEPGGEPTFDEAYDCIIEAGCALVTRCFLPFTVEQCKSLDLEVYDLDVYYHREVIRQGLAEGTVEFHPEEVAACFEAVTGKECPFVFEHGGSDFDIGDLCPGVLTGTVASDGACFSATECEQPGSRCDLSPDCSGEICCAGICIFPVADEVSCDGPPCGIGSHCVGGICRSGEEGQPCGTTNDCDEGFWCNGESCQPEIESGADCFTQDQCPGPEVCVFPPGFKLGMCARIDQVDAPCDDFCMGLQCDQPDPGALGRCTPYLAEEGADCSRLECSPSFECDRGADQCVPKGDVGAECVDTFDDCLPGLFCDLAITGGEPPGHCSGRLADGATCTGDDQCESGLCAVDPEVGFGGVPMICTAIPDCRP